jgi:hypothetical protein
LYRKTGKVVEVDGAKDVDTVWTETKAGLLSKKSPDAGNAKCAACTIF